MKKNIPLLKKLRTRFLRMRHPQHFNMRVIAEATDCGAAMCLIGHTLDLAGYKMRKRAAPDSSVMALLDFDFIRPNGKRVSDTLREAATLWGIGPEQAEDIFMDFSIETPKQAAERITELIAKETQ